MRPDVVCQDAEDKGDLVQKVTLYLNCRAAEAICLSVYLSVHLCVYLPRPTLKKLLPYSYCTQNFVSDQLGRHFFNVTK